MAFELVVLRILHIVAGTFWVGSAIFTTFFLIPALTQTGGVIAGQVMSAIKNRHLFTWLPLAALVTILSGLRLWWIVGGGDLHYFQHRSGHAYAVSGAMAVVAFLLSLLVARPATVRVASLAHAAASDETSRRLISDEVTKLQKRATLSSNVAVALLLLSAVGMAIARYL